MRGKITERRFYETRKPVCRSDEVSEKKEKLIKFFL